MRKTAQANEKIEQQRETFRAISCEAFEFMMNVQRAKNEKMEVLGCRYCIYRTDPCEFPY